MSKNDIKIRARRAQVWEMYGKGCTQQEMMGALGVSQSTIARDVADLKLMNGMPDPEVERERIAEIVANEILRSSGILRMRYIDRYCKLLGLDAPVKADLTTGGEPIQHTTAVDMGALLANPETRKALETLSESIGHDVNQIV